MVNLTVTTFSPTNPKQKYLVSRSVLCFVSIAMIRWESTNACWASLNETPCFLRFAVSFLESHSNSIWLFRHTYWNTSTGVNTQPPDIRGCSSLCIHLGRSLRKRLENRRNDTLLPARPWASVFTEIAQEREDPILADIERALFSIDCVDSSRFRSPTHRRYIFSEAIYTSTTIVSYAISTSRPVAAE